MMPDLGKLTEDELYDTLAEGLGLLPDSRIVSLITNNITDPMLEEVYWELDERFGEE